MHEMYLHLKPYIQLQNKVILKNCKVESGLIRNACLRIFKANVIALKPLPIFSYFILNSQWLYDLRTDWVVEDLQSKKSRYKLKLLKKKITLDLAEEQKNGGVWLSEQMKSEIQKQRCNFHQTTSSFAQNNFWTSCGTHWSSWRM